MIPFAIRRLDVAALDIPLHEPFGIAGGAQHVAANVLVSVELHGGERGYGEAAPFPAFNGETQAHAMSAVHEARARVVGQDARAWRKIAASLAGLASSARCAIEMAVLDALARRAGLSLDTLFGGASRSLVTDVTITTGSVRAAREAATRWEKEGFSRLKVKIGGAPIDHDLERLAAIVAAAPRAAIMLDGNGGLDAKSAIAIVDALAAHGVHPILFEQPVPGGDLDGMAEIVRRTRVPVAADESADKPEDVLTIAKARAAHVINIKIMKSGIAGALSIALAARAAGFDLMVGGMVEARLAMSASACLAGGLGGFAFVDLDTPLFLADDPFDGGYTQQSERIDLGPITTGHGVLPKRSPW